jgi:hypothetical protein
MSENLLDFTEHSYNRVDGVEVVFDKDNKAVDKQNIALTPFQVIKGLANTLGQTINDPIPSCKQCYGRGYTGRDATTKAPIPCQCIFPKENKATNDYIQNRTQRMSRAERRNWERTLKKNMKYAPKIDEGESFDSI